MVARVNTGYSLYHMVNYNENKVTKGVATCISAGNYPLDPVQMNMYVKLGCMQKQMELNHRAKRTSMHISLNFSPSETNLTKEKLTAIADAYMQGIGFGQQPFLVYQHYDAGHPHIHIVSTTVRRDGTNIDTYEIGKRMSEPVRKSIEKEFALVRAEDQGKQQQYRPEPVSVAKVDYGRLETKKAIQDVLEHVLTRYRYASLSELNAVLGRYNIRADRGQEGSRVFSRGGLLYHVLDSNGNPVGVPIKASSFYNKPKLSKLEEYFQKNTDKPAPQKSRLRNAVDLALKGKGITLNGLADDLSAKGIDLVVRRNTDGFVYGLTYVDHVSKYVFNGSELGKSYSAKAVQERCLLSGLESRGLDSQQVQKFSQIVSGQMDSTNTTVGAFSWDAHSTGASLFSELLDCLIQPEYTSDYIPYELRQQNRKKRKKKRSVNH